MSQAIIPQASAVAPTSGTWVATNPSPGVVCVEATGPATADVITACGHVQVEVPRGKSAKITLDNGVATVEFS